MNIYARHAVDGIAARVVSQGFKYIPEKKIQTADSEFPLLINERPRLPKGTKSLSGKKFGSFIVIGMSLEVRGRWVCRCNCGIYTLRTRRAVENLKNNDDRCEICRHKQFLKKKIEGALK